MSHHPYIKSEPMIEEDQDELLMSYLNSDYMTTTANWTSPPPPKNHSNEPSSYEQSTLLWEMNQGLLYSTSCSTDVVLSNMTTLNPLMDMFISQPTSPRSYCSSSSSDSEQPKKRRGRKKREQTTPPMIAPAPLKPLAVLLPAKQQQTQQPLLQTSVDATTKIIEPTSEETATITKRQERLIKNRAAALLSRKRKREHLNNLEDKCNHLTATNQALEKRILELEKENKELNKKLDVTSNSSDHFLVMIICYLVFIVSFSLYIPGFSSHQTNTPNSSLINSPDVVSSISYLEEDKENTFRRQVRKRKQFQRILFPTL